MHCGALASRGHSGRRLRPGRPVARARRTWCALQKPRPPLGHPHDRPACTARTSPFRSARPGGPKRSTGSHWPPRLVLHGLTGTYCFGRQWDFLVRRGLSYPPTSSRSIWFPHNEHWSTLPVLLWRGLYHFVHLSSYWPYLVPVLLAQVAVMHLAWRICKHNSVDPWVAMAAVALLGFLGAGPRTSSAFQVSFVGSVLFGFVAFDLLDRPNTEPAWTRRARRLSVVRPAG